MKHGKFEGQTTSWSEFSVAFARDYKLLHAWKLVIDTHFDTIKKVALFERLGRRLMLRRLAMMGWISSGANNDQLIDNLIKNVQIRYNQLMILGLICSIILKKTKQTKVVECLKQCVTWIERHMCVTLEMHSLMLPKASGLCSSLLLSSIFFIFSLYPFSGFLSLSLSEDFLLWKNKRYLKKNIKT